MKNILYSVLLFLSFLSCKKQTPFPHAAEASKSAANSGYLQKMSGYLKARMPDSLYQKLDTTSGTLNIEDTRWYFRIGFRDRPMESEFVLLTTDSLGNVSDGRIIELSRDPGDLKTFNGALRVRQLTGELLTASTITDRYVDSWHDNKKKVAVSSTEILIESYPEEDPVYQELPEVYVYPDGGGGIDYYLLLSSLSGSSGVGGSGYGAGSGGSVSSGIYTRAAAPAASPVARPAAGRPQTITVETSYSKPAVNLPAYFKCFGAVPDAGASYTVNLYVDLPVNDDPMQIFNQATGAVGHSFLGLTKSGTDQSVTQYFGFASTQPMSAIVGSVTPGKVVDNAGHKFNASLSIPVNAGQFGEAMNSISRLSGSNYDLTNFNCVDFALSVVNSFQPTTPIIPAVAQMPGGGLAFDTPQGLYLTLQHIQNTGGAALTDGIWNAGPSHGACQ